MTILDLVRIIRTNLKLLLLSMLLGIVVAAGYTLTRPVEYQATSTAQIMAGASNDASAAMVNQQLANQRSGAYAQLASGSGVADRVVALSNGALSPGDFVLAGAGSEGTSNLSLTASSSSAAKAQQAANLAPAALSQEIKHIETLNGAKSTVYDAYPLSRAGLPGVADVTQVARQPSHRRLSGPGRGDDPGRAAQAA
ncbi:Wzz/FepE/Etk N-terminal domain-containing protein [Dermacoccus nishinomiyaensis]